MRLGAVNAGVVIVMGRFWVSVVLKVCCDWGRMWKGVAE